MYLFFLAHDVFLFLFGLSMIRGYTLICICFLFHIALLIYIYEVIHVICLYFVLCEIKKLFFFFTCIFHTCVYVFVECFKKYTG